MNDKLTTLDTKMTMLMSDDGKTIILQSSTGIGITLQGRVNKMEKEAGEKARKANEAAFRGFLEDVAKRAK